MTVFMSALTEWWGKRAVRERRMLQLLGGLLAALFVWYGVLLPLQKIANEAEARYARASRQLQDVESAANAFKRISAGTGRENSSLADVVSSAAADLQLVLDGQRPGAENEVTVALHAADPALLFPWIEQLQQRHGIVVLNFAATRDGEGWLDAEIVLARNAL